MVLGVDSGFVDGFAGLCAWVDGLMVGSFCFRFVV